MRVEFRFTTYGEPATSELSRAINSVKNGNPLTPVNVIVPSNLVGVSARRVLAARCSNGLVAVHFETILSLARRLAETSLSKNRRKITDPVVAASSRSVLEKSAELLRPVSRHPATERALVKIHRELRELDDEDLDSLQKENIKASEVVRLHREMKTNLSKNYFDETDIYLTAADIATSNHQLLKEIGTLIFHIPERLPQSGLNFVISLAKHIPVHVVVALTGHSEVDIQICKLVEKLGGKTPKNPPKPPVSQLSVRSVSDPDEEARLAVREILTGARKGIPLSRMAVAYPGGNSYARLIHQYLTFAKVPFNGVDGRRLGESLTGRTLQAILGLPDHDFSRTDIMAMLSSGAILNLDQKPVPVTAWERLARNSGVVSGVSQWSTHLKRHINDKETQFDEFENKAVDVVQLSSLREEIINARGLLAFIEQLVNDLDRSQIPTHWPGLAKWSIQLLNKYLGSPGHQSEWPNEEINANAKIIEIIGNLANLKTVEPAPDFTNFRRAVANELDHDINREGSFGNGVFVGSYGTITGLDFDLVIAVGLAEGITPLRLTTDPLLPDAVRQTTNGTLPLRAEENTDLLRDVLATFASGNKERVLTFPRGDLGVRTQLMPSRWLLDQMATKLGERPTPAQLTNLQTDWYKSSLSFTQSLEQLDFPSDHHEYVLAELLNDYYQNIFPDMSNRRSKDTVLNRGISLIQGRKKTYLTRFDGYIKDSDSLSLANRQTVLSASQLENWVKCPHAYFMRYVLGVESIDKPVSEDGITPLQRGSLVHRILDRFFTETISNNDLPKPHESWRIDHHEQLDLICNQEFDLIEAHGLTGRRLLWQRDSDRLRKTLQEFLIVDNNRRKNNLLTPIATEMAFGFDGTHPLIINLDNGRKLRFRGHIDRIDQTADGSLIVTDYKTGKRKHYTKISETSPDVNGQYLQLPLYGLAARNQLSKSNVNVEARYWFLMEENQIIGYSLSSAVLKRFNFVLKTITDCIEQGIFPAHPPSSAYELNCTYCNPNNLDLDSLNKIWKRKRNDPLLTPYRHLIGDLESNDV